MLRTNSKKAIENIKNFVMKETSFEGLGYEGIKKDPETFSEMGRLVWSVYFAEVGKWNNHREPLQVNFKNWLAGLPSCGLGDFFCKYSAVDLLGDILEETEEEKARYTEEQAETTLSYLIYREIAKVQ